MEVDQDFVKAQSDNLPKVDMFMVARYFSESRSHVGGEMQEKKLSESQGKSYGDDAISDVQVKRKGSICTVKCDVTPELNATYHCTLKCNEDDDQILNVECETCTATRRNCEHSIAFIMYLCRRTDKPASTTVKCDWKMPTITGVHTLQFIKAKDMGPPQAKNIIKCDDETFFEKIKEKLQELQVKCQLATYVCDTPVIAKLSMHHLLCMFKKEARYWDFRHFMSFCRSIMTEEHCEALQNTPMAQSESLLWYQMRYGRVIGFEAYSAAYCRPDDSSLIEGILGRNINHSRKVVERRKAITKSVIKEVEKLKNIVMKPTGIILSPEFPFFGATPECISEDYVIEVKCLNKIVRKTSYFNNVNVHNNYYAQIQSHMHVTKKKIGLFCITQPNYDVTNKIEINEVAYDKPYCDELFSKIEGFWENFIYKTLINPETQ